MRPATIGRDSGRPTPWGTGLLVAALCAALTTVALVAFGTALAAVSPVLTVLVNLVAVGGMAPTLLRWRSAPVARWVIYGIGAGVVLGWFGLSVAALAGR
ncbi:DUF2537 domain-containing protein [Skermania piniformis]|uniref:DUF2537 domain-containing protein n=1 Tax=Skermania pinensis TaxID=39122 RepID=A0ABX8S6B9_9ACTN|nr:DUF2537 domain-containing protein [Skermania piniformis]QXQ13390.1 DUF2537 domain-containing protein [Skermania piniformis]